MTGPKKPEAFARDSRAAQPRSSPSPRGLGVKSCPKFASCTQAGRSPFGAFSIAVARPRTSRKAPTCVSKPGQAQAELKLFREPGATLDLLIYANFQIPWGWLSQRTIGSLQKVFVFQSGQSLKQLSRGKTSSGACSPSSLATFQMLLEKPRVLWLAKSRCKAQHVHVVLICSDSHLVIAYNSHLASFSYESGQGHASDLQTGGLRHSASSGARPHTRSHASAHVCLPFGFFQWLQGVRLQGVKARHSALTPWHPGTLAPGPGNKSAQASKI